MHLQCRIAKNPRVSGPTLFKPIIFKGQLPWFFPLPLHQGIFLEVFTAQLDTSCSPLCSNTYRLGLLSPHDTLDRQYLGGRPELPIRRPWLSSQRLPGVEGSCWEGLAGKALRGCLCQSLITSQRQTTMTWNHQCFAPIGENWLFSYASSRVSLEMD